MLRLPRPVGLALAIAHWKRALRDIAIGTTIAAAGAALLVAALAFLLAAAHSWLAERLGVAGSAAIIGGALLMVGLLLIVFASRFVEQSTAKERRPDEIADDRGDRAARAVAPSKASPFSNPLVQAASLAFLVGIVLGRRGSHRDRPLE
jgi:hypothetical protein